MKKIIVFFFSAALIFCALFSLSSCKDTLYAYLPSDERAMKIDELSSKKMEEAFSYNVETSADIKLEVNGIETTAIFEGYRRLAVDGRHEVSDTLEIEAAGVSKTVTASYGYQDGFYYKSETVDGETRGIYSSISKEDYEEHTNSAFTFMNSERALEKSSEEQAGGGWKLVFKSFDEEAISEIKYYFSDILFDAEIEDMTVVIILDNDLFYETVSIELIFTKESKVSEFIYEITCNDINTGNVVIDDVGLDSYTETEDLQELESVIRRANDALSHFPEDGSMRSVSVTVEQTEKKNGRTDTYYESGEISFGTADGKFKYNISFEIISSDTSKYVIAYENEKQLIRLYTKGGTLKEKYEQASDDSTQRTYVKSFLGLVLLEEYSVTSFTEIETDTYVIECTAQNILSAGAAYPNAKVTVTVSFDGDGALTELNCACINYTDKSEDNFNFSTTINYTFGANESNE